MIARLPACNSLHEFAVLDYRVVDADTIETMVDLSWSTTYTAFCRLHGIDTPEKYTLAGKLVTRLVETWMERQKRVMVQSIQLDKFGGRYDGILSGSDDSADNTTWVRLNEYLIEKSLADPYLGDKKIPMSAKRFQEITDNASAILANWGVVTTAKD